MLVGVGALFITFGLVKSRFESPKAGMILGTVGFIQLGFAALMETILDPLPINYLKGFITIDPNIVPLALDGNWAIGTGSTLATTVVMVLVTAWMIRVSVKVIEGEA